MGDMMSTNRTKDMKGSDPLKLNSKHRLLMRALITGMKQKDAAEACGFTIVRVSQLVNSPLFKGEMERMHSHIESMFMEKVSDAFNPALEARQLINEATFDAANVLINLSKTADSESERGKSARDILDRGGVIKTERHEIDATLALPAEVAASVKAAVERSGIPTIDMGESREGESGGGES